MDIDESLVKPCPYCGKKPEVWSDWIGGPPEVYQIECNNADCDINPAVWSHDEMVTLKMWNAIQNRNKENKDGNRIL